MTEVLAHVLTEDVDEEIVTISVLCTALNQLGQYNGPGTTEKLYQMPALPEGEIVEISVIFSDEAQGGTVDVGGPGAEPVGDPLEGPSLDVTNSSDAVGTFETTSATARAAVCLKNPSQHWCWELDGSNDDKCALVDETAGVRVAIVEPGAPTQSIYVEANGDIGFGGAPTENGHFQRTTSPIKVLVETSAADGVASLSAKNDVQEWCLRVNGAPAYSDQLELYNATADTTPFAIKTNVPDDFCLVTTAGLQTGDGSVNQYWALDGDTDAMIWAVNQGVPAGNWRAGSKGGEYVIRDHANSRDVIRVATGALANRIYCSATSGRIGFNETSPTTPFHFNAGSNTIAMQLQSTGVACNFQFKDSGTGATLPTVGSIGNNLQVTALNTLILSATTAMQFKQASVSRIDIDSSSNVIFNDTGASVDHRFEGDTDPNLLFLDGSADKIAVGHNTPTQKVHLKSTTGAIGCFVESTAAAAVDLFLKNLNGSWSSGTASTGPYTWNDLLNSKIPMLIEPAAPNFAVTVKATTGNVGVVQYSPAAQLHVTQWNTAGAQPCLELDQDDINEEFIEFDGTSASDGTRSLSSNTGTAGACTGKIRITVNGTTRWIRHYTDHT